MTRKKLGCSWVPEFIFHDCCVEHDKQYDAIRNRVIVGWTSVRIGRYSADICYLDNMLNAIHNHDRHKRFYTAIAYTYYYGVRLFGGFTI